MIILAILLTTYLFWSLYSFLMEILDYETKYEKLNIAIHITNWANISISMLILFILFVRFIIKSRTIICIYIIYLI